MHKELLAAAVAALVGVGAVAQGAPTADREAERIAAAVVAIHEQLVKLKADYPQLEGIEEARRTSTSLEYARGTASWPGGFGSDVVFDIRAGCHLRLCFAFPAEEQRGFGQADLGSHFSHAGLGSSFYLTSDPRNAKRDEFERTVRRIVSRESVSLGKWLNRRRLEPVCGALRAKVDAGWRPDEHNAFRSRLVVRGQVKGDEDGVAADYLILPLGAGEDPCCRTALGLYGAATGTVTLLGIGPRFAAVEVLRGRPGRSVEVARAALADVLALSPAPISMATYRGVLAAAERALARAGDGKIAAGQVPAIAPHNGGWRFIWEITTDRKAGYRVVVDRAKGGSLSAPDVTLGL